MMQRDRRKGGKAMWKNPATRRGRRASPLSCPNHDRTLPLSQRRCDDLGSIDSRLIPVAVMRYGMGRLFSGRRMLSVSSGYGTMRPVDELAGIESSSLHQDILCELKRIHSHICSIAWPVLEAAGELQPSA